MLNIEVRNEVGSGGGAVHVQNAAYAAKYAAGPAGVLRQFSVCPTLLIELAGPNMNLSGAVFSNVLVCNQLTPMVSVVTIQSFDAARCFAALRMALPRLLAYYDRIQSDVMRQQLDFPYPSGYQMAVIKYIFSTYSCSAACVPKGSFSHMASLFSSSSVGHTVLLHVTCGSCRIRTCVLRFSTACRAGC